MTQSEGASGLPIVKICEGRSCAANFSQYVFERAEAEKKLRGLEVALEHCPCQGRCEKGPTVRVEKGDQVTLHERVDPVKVSEILKQICL